MNDTKTIQGLAEETRKWFEQAERRDEEKTTYWRTKDGHPQWIQDMCHEAHNSPTIGDLLPEDYRYMFIVEALDALEECGEDDEPSEYLPEEVYTYNLTQWLGSHNARSAFVDEAREQFGGSGSVIGDIMQGYRLEQEEVLMSVQNYLQTRLDELDDTSCLKHEIG
jgi:hypothetical protein